MSDIDYNERNEAESIGAEAAGPQPHGGNECDAGTGAALEQGAQFQGTGAVGTFARIEGLLAQLRRLDTDADGRALKAFITRLVRDESEGSLACLVEVLEQEVVVG